MKPKYKMVGFSQYDGPMFEEDVTADRAQEIAEDKDLVGYLLHAPWQARRKKRPEERTYRYGTPTYKPYKQTSCRRLLFRVILSHKEKHVPEWDEIDNR